MANESEVEDAFRIWWTKWNCLCNTDGSCDDDETMECTIATVNKKSWLCYDEVCEERPTEKEMSEAVGNRPSWHGGVSSLKISLDFRGSSRTTKL